MEIKTKTLWFKYKCPHCLGDIMVFKEDTPLVDEIGNIFSVLNRFKLKIGEGKNWELHHEDIVINSSKFRELRREFLKNGRS